MNSSVSEDFELVPHVIGANIRELEALLVNQSHLLVNLEQILVKLTHLLVSLKQILVNSSVTQKYENFRM
ncbi:hypothetical protein [Peribacillus frigoritolerans]|uniref:hypothetical protein n=1 Tax=Peribacillus frigoritolerans TaxID=450367 RepID=UPI002024DC8A|nr:hypothetical protein [Peribacillus frigoritolerans]